MEKTKKSKLVIVHLMKPRSTAYGFKNVYGEETVDTAASRPLVLISPSGFAINLIRHKK